MPQDAARMNKLQIREQEELNRQRRLRDQATERRKQEQFQKAKEGYAHIPSHGYGKTAGGAADDVEIRVFVRECDGAAGHHFSYREGRGGSATMSAPTAAPARNSRGAAPATTSSLAQQRLQRGSAECPVETPQRGAVPRYLQQRKAELAAEKEAVTMEVERQKELSKIPAGHRLVPEAEKADTLRQLEERRKELETQLGKIPIRFDTHSIQQRRRDIEEELRQIETARVKYSTKNPLYLPLY